MPAEASAARLPALLPRGHGHQFVVYGDSCSGIAGAAHEKTFASVNAIVRRLEPPPEFIAFLGDEVAGLTADRSELEAQWRHWLQREMAWLDREAIPLWNTTSNHTTYDEMSEAAFRAMLDHLPRNGPPGQEGLSYFVRRGDLLMVFVHTMWTGLGGEGHVETTWLREVLQRHADARHKLVLGHHPVFPINGFSGPYQREIGPEHAADFWNVLVEGGVLAYLCSHILAFDVQVHRGVLQVCTAGAGTAHRMPEGIEYLHCVQGALDAEGVRYQVLDTEGRVRERLSWPLPLADVTEWQTLPAGVGEAPLVGGPYDDRILGLRFTGRAAAAGAWFGADAAVGLPAGPADASVDRPARPRPAAHRDRRSRGASQPALLVWAGRRGGFAVRPSTRHSHGHGAGRLPLSQRGRGELVVARCRLGLGCRAPRLAGALVHRPRRARSGRPALQGIGPRGIGAGLAVMRDIQRDELEPLATGAWILGAGGGGNPYLSYLNLCRLYDTPAR